MNYLISIITTIVLLAACTKHSNKEITVTGRLMQSCDNPAANKNGMIRLPGGGVLNKPSTSLEFTTDENGYFKVTHNESFSTFSVRTSANHSVLDVSSLGGDEKELGEVYIFPPSGSYYLYLEVNNTYTENDTLHYGNAGFPEDGREPWLKKAGPFTNGIIDTVPIALNLGALPMQHNPPDHLHGPRIRLDYYLNEYDSWEDHDKFVYISTPHCQVEYQTVTLVID
jgi:hypothetical protein